MLCFACLPIAFFPIACLFLLVFGLLAFLPNSPLNYDARERARYHNVYQKRSVKSPWLKREALALDVVHPARIALKQRNLDKAQATLMNLSSPSSPNYGKHLTTTEVAELFAPADESVQKTKAWLVGSGISKDRIFQSSNRGWLAFDASVKELDDLIQMKCNIYIHASNGETTVACDDYKLPAHIQEHIDFVEPGVQSAFKIQDHFDDPPIAPGIVLSESAVQSLDVSTCDEAITPACVRALYKFPENSVIQSVNNLGILSANGLYSQPDLDQFATVVPGADRVPLGTMANNILMNPPEYVDDGHIGEANLDFQMAWPIVYPQNITQFAAFANPVQAVQRDEDPTDLRYYSNKHFDQTFNAVLEAIDSDYCETLKNSGAKANCRNLKPTNVLSISYISSETKHRPEEQNRICQEFLKLALQGTSVIIASGDHGVATHGDSGPVCDRKFEPNFPSTCPWVTSVGATTIRPGRTVDDLESSAFAPGWSSGGGFSNYWTIPDYQKKHIESYLRETSLPFKSYSGDGPAHDRVGGVFNSLGRAYPDVSAIGENIVVSDQGRFHLVRGTSASAPIFASIITLINGERIAAGKPPIGFLNTVIYEHPEVFNDVEQGVNPGCGTQGFMASDGWDPVTGLGTPNYPKLRDLFMKLR